MTETYTPPTISGYNDDAPDDDGSQISSNIVQWQKHIDEIGDPIKAYADAISAETDDGFERIDARNARNILEFDADPTGATSSQTALDNARTWLAAQSGGATLIFPTGIYTYTTSPNWALDNCRIIAQGTVRLRYAGTSVAFTLDAGSGSENVYNMEVGPFIIEAPSTATNGVYIRAVHHSTIKVNVRGCGTSEYGVLMSFCVANRMHVTVSVNEAGSWYSSGQPVSGIYISARSGVPAAYNTFYTPIIEGVSGDGIHINSGFGNMFLGGTSEGCGGWGVRIESSTSTLNKFVGMDFESNTSGDIITDSDNTQIISCDSEDLIRLQDGGSTSLILGGFHQDITIDANCQGALLIGCVYSRAAGGSISDSGDLTRYFGVLSNQTNTSTEVITSTSDDTTPSVSGDVRVMGLPANTGPTAITQLDGARSGQIVTLICLDSSNASTIADSGNFKLSAAWSPNVDDTITLVTFDGTTWREVSRSTN